MELYMRIRPISRVGMVGDRKPRATISIRSVGGGKTQYTVTEFPGGKRTELPEQAAWDLHNKINMEV